MMVIHVLVVNCLLHNPDAFANQLIRVPATEKFKADPSLQTMMQYLIDSILMRRRTVQRTRNIWDSNLYVRPEADQAPQQRQSRSRRCLDHTDEDQSDASAGPPETTSKRRPTSSLGATPNLASHFRRVTSTSASSGHRSWSQSSSLSDISSISPEQTPQAGRSRRPAQRPFTANARQRSRMVGGWMLVQADAQEEDKRTKKSQKVGMKMTRIHQGH